MTQPGSKEQSLNMAKMIEELRRDEGVVPYAYQDSESFWTIGVGRLIDKRKGGRLSNDEIDYLLKNDIARFSAELDERLPWWRDLDEVRRRVILNMAFNLGVDGLLKFRNTLAAVRAGEWDRAAVGMLSSLWARQVKGRASRLAKMMRTGEA
jgi:lysozyme